MIKIMNCLDACSCNWFKMMWKLHNNLFVRLLQAQEQGRVPEHTSKFYAKGALEYLVPILTHKLTNQVGLYEKFTVL